MACEVYINDVLQTLRENSLKAQMIIEERSIATFDVIDMAGTATILEGQVVEIYDENDNLAFGGFIDTIGSQRYTASGGKLHQITCKDNHYLADKRIVVKSYSNKTCEYIVEDLLTSYLADEGITEGEIQTGVTLDEVVFNYVKPSDCLNILAERAGYIWYISADKKLYFIDRATYTAPWQLDNSTYRPIGTPRKTDGNPQYRNRQYIKGGTGKTSTITENFTGDGTTQSFTLGYQLAETPTITEDSVSKTVGIKGIDSGKDYYWNKGEPTIYAETAPANAVDVEIQYKGQYPLIAIAENYDAIVSRAAIEGGTGIVEDVALEAYHESADSIQESASAKLKKYCQSAIKYTYPTDEPGLLPGQIQQITDSLYGYSAEEMLIESVTLMTDKDYVYYEVTCITGPTLGSWTKFFSNLITRQDNSIRIGDADLIALLSKSETLEMTESGSINEDEFATSGEVNRWLNSAPITAGSLHNVQHERLEMTESGSESHHLTKAYKYGDGCKYGFATYK